MNGANKGASAPAHGSTPAFFAKRVTVFVKKDVR